MKMRIQVIVALGLSLSCAACKHQQGSSSVSDASIDQSGVSSSTPTAVPLTIQIRDADGNIVCSSSVPAALPEWDLVFRHPDSGTLSISAPDEAGCTATSLSVPSSGVAGTLDVLDSNGEKVFDTYSLQESIIIQIRVFTINGQVVKSFRKQHPDCSLGFGSC